MQSPAFGWQSDGVGALALVGAASAVAAPCAGHGDDSGRYLEHDHNFQLADRIRTRVATLCMVSMFGGGAVTAWLTGVVWSHGGWAAVCMFGGVSAALSALTAWLGVGRRPVR